MGIMKRPAFMFYPADWRKDPELRVCSIAARGLWIDMIALMHEGEPYGHLVVNGVAVSDVQLARLVGESVGMVRKLLAELESHNVFSRNESGAVYSRRMVQDERLRTLRAESGKLGGNPNLIGKGKVKGVVNQNDKQNPTPSVAVAVSPSEQPQQPPPKQAGDPRFDGTFAKYPRRAGSSGKADALKAWRARLAAGVNPDEIDAGVERYAAFIRATGKEGTEYVKQASTFFGPSRHWEEPWDVPAGGRKLKTIMVFENGWYTDVQVPA